MSQSSIIAGSLLAAFIFWLAVNDRLQAYTAVLWGPTAAPKPGVPGGPNLAPGVAPPGGMGGLPIPDLLPGGAGNLLSEAGPLLLEAF